MVPGTDIHLLTNIDLLRGPERPPLFSLPTLTSRHSPLRTAERAGMPETTLLSAFLFFSKFQFKVLFGGKLKFLLPLCLKLLFFGSSTHTTCTWTTSPFVTYGTVQLVFEQSFHHTRGPNLMISGRLITSSSAQLRTAAHSSASSAARRHAVPFPGVPCRAFLCGAVLCDAVQCCAVLCRGECFAVDTLILMNHNKDAPPTRVSPQQYIGHSSATPCGSFNHTRGRSLMISAWLITSSAQLRTAAHSSSASSAAQRKLSNAAIAQQRSDSSAAQRQLSSAAIAQQRNRATVNSSAQAALGIINSLVAPNHGPLLSAPFTYMF